jgi:hypothetical protein
VAYTWFNRFAALRYMEIHDYLGHGHRACCRAAKAACRKSSHATELVGVLPGLNAAQIADLKLAGNKDGELYRLLAGGPVQRTLPRHALSLSSASTTNPNCCCPTT